MTIWGVHSSSYLWLHCHLRSIEHSPSHSIQRQIEQLRSTLQHPLLEATITHLPARRKLSTRTTHHMQRCRSRTGMLAADLYRSAVAFCNRCRRYGVQIRQIAPVPRRLMQQSQPSFDSFDYRSRGTCPGCQPCSVHASAGVHLGGSGWVR